jgi:hypothetical protein
MALRVRTLGQVRVGAGSRMGFASVGDEGEPVVEADTVVLRRVDKGVAQLVESLAHEERRRKITLILTGIGAVFAAAKLGIIAFPHIKKWSSDR